MRASAHVTMFPSGIARQLSEIDGYYSGQSTGMEEKATGDRDHIQELSDEDDDQEEGHGDSSAKYGEEGEMEDERAVHWVEEDRNKLSAIVWTQTGYAFVEERRKKTDKVTGGDDKWARMEQEVPAVSTSASHQEMRTIMKAVALSKQLAKLDAIENMSRMNSQAPKVRRKWPPALDTGHYLVHGTSQLNYNILAHLERETGELTFQLLPKAKNMLCSQRLMCYCQDPSCTKGNWDHSHFCHLRHERLHRIYQLPIYQGLCHRPRKTRWARIAQPRRWWVWNLRNEWRDHQRVQHQVESCWLEDDYCWWQLVWFDKGGRVCTPQRPWYSHSCDYLCCKIRIRTSYHGPAWGIIHLNVWEEPRQWQLGDHHPPHRLVSAGDVSLFTSGRQEG